MVSFVSFNKILIFLMVTLHINFWFLFQENEATNIENKKPIAVESNVKN